MKPYMELIFLKRMSLFRENEEIDYLFFFVEGKAKAFNTLSNGKSVLLCFMIVAVTWRCGVNSFPKDYIKCTSNGRFILCWFTIRKSEK